MDWIQFVIFILGNMVFTMTLWLWNRTESRTDTRRSLDLIEAIKDEMKDFHGRLERQDAEFKSSILLLEEKMKNG